MKTWFVTLLFLSNTCMAQSWMAEVLAGASGYNGDLTQSLVSVKRFRPAANLNLKYRSGDFLNLRLGLGWGIIGANDKDNRDPGLQERNLNFKSNIFEANLILEANIFDPEDFYTYPYAFMGVGVFHFDPYTFDNSNQKVFLNPLNTEGQGFAEYPDRKKYALTQVCIPFGFGLRRTINQRWEIGYEIGSRYCFTDYLDDVSTRYIDPEILIIKRGQVAAEMAYRRKVPFNLLNEVRGNSRVKDFYFFSGIKIGVVMGKVKKAVKKPKASTSSSDKK